MNSPEVMSQARNGRLPSLRIGDRRPENMKPDEAIVYDFVTELTLKHQVSDET